MKQTAAARKVGFGPTVKALIDVLGDTIESIMYEDDEDTHSVSFLEDDLDISMPEVFHDADTSPPSSPQSEE